MPGECRNKTIVIRPQTCYTAAVLHHHIIIMSEDWSIKPPLPDYVFPWENHDPKTPEEVEAFFHSPEIVVIKERMCDMGRRLWQRAYVDGNGGNISVRVAKNLVLCSPTLCSKGYMKVEDICLVDMEGRQKAGYRPSTSEVKTHIAMMREVGVNSCIHAHPPCCNAFLFAGTVPPSGINPEADIFLGHIALAPYGTPGSPETAKAVAEASRQSTVVFMENHGVITGARHVEEAYWFMENADAYCRMVLLAGLHKAPLNQVPEAGVEDFLAIRKALGYTVPEGQPLYNMSEYAGYTLGRPGKK